MLYFRRREMTWTEWKREAISSVISRVSRVERVAKPHQPNTVGTPQTSQSTTLTVKAAAFELNCSISFVYKLMYLGQLAYEKRGRRRLPTVASIAEYRQ